MTKKQRVQAQLARKYADEYLTAYEHPTREDYGRDGAMGFFEGGWTEATEECEGLGLDVDDVVDDALDIIEDSRPAGLPTRRQYAEPEGC